MCLPVASVTVLVGAEKAQSRSIGGSTGFKVAKHLGLDLPISSTFKRPARSETMGLVGVR